MCLMLGKMMSSLNHTDGATWLTDNTSASLQYFYLWLFTFDKSYVTRILMILNNWNHLRVDDVLIKEHY